MEARRQIAVGIEIRQRHIILCSGKCFFRLAITKSNAETLKSQIRGQRSEIRSQSFQNPCAFALNRNPAVETKTEWRFIQNARVFGGERGQSGEIILRLGK